MSCYTKMKIGVICESKQSRKANATYRLHICLKFSVETPKLQVYLSRHAMSCCDHFWLFFVWLWCHSRLMRVIICASQSLKSCCNRDNLCFLKTFVCVLGMFSHIWRTRFVGSGILCSSPVLILALFYTHVTFIPKWELLGARLLYLAIAILIIMASR